MAVIVPNWDAKATILAVAPDDGGKLNKGQSALCVGVVIGMVTTGRDHNCVVLDHVMAAPISVKRGGND